MTKPYALVEWLDSFGGDASAWLTHDDADTFAATPEHLRCRSVGFLWHDCPESITLAQSLNQYQAMYLMTIPRVAITHLTIIPYDAPPDKPAKARRRPNVRRARD
jgi:hypothetical protein